MKTFLITLVCTVVGVAAVFSQTTDRKRIIFPYNLELSNGLVEKPNGSLFEENKSAICSNTSLGTIPLIDCDDIGETAYNTNSLVSTVDYTASATPPSSTPSCWDGTELYGNWSVYTLSTGGDALMIETDAFGSYTSTDYVRLTFFQGPDCNNLTEIACEELLTRTSTGWTTSDIMLNDLDPTQKLWVFTVSDYLYSLDIRMRGMISPSNTACSSGIEEYIGCNVGAPGDDSWTGPSLDGVMCSGTDCGWTLEKYDTGGNGWGPGYLDILVNGTSVGTFNLSSGGFGTDNFEILPEATVQIVYYPGTNNNKNYFKLIDPYGDLVYTSSTMPNSSATILTFTGYCAHTWYSNENTVYYTFTATNEVATIDINNVNCNDGTVGEAQFGVWQSCGDVGDYSGSSSFMGCAVGAGTLAMPSLTVGETYIIAVDGQAGDICTWDFVTTGIQLPVELINLSAQAHLDYNLITWETASETNSDYFDVQRSEDGYVFKTIGSVKAMGNSQAINRYEYIDRNATEAVSYYRLKQVDMDGRVDYHGPVSVKRSTSEEVVVIPNPIKGVGVVSFPTEKGEEYLYSIKDLSGRIVSQGSFVATYSNEALTIDATAFNSGMYVLNISDGSQMYTSTFVKQ